MGCGASARFELDDHVPQGKRDKVVAMAARSVDIGGGVYRKQGFEAGLVTLPFPDEPDVNTVWKVVERSARVHAAVNCIGSRTYDKKTKTWGEYAWTTFADFKVCTERFGIGLMAHFPHLKAGCHVGIYGPSTQELLITQYGCFSQSLVITPMYDTWTGEVLEYVLVHADLEVIVVSQKQVDPIRDVLMKAAGKHKVKGLVVLPDAESEDKVVEIPEQAVVKYADVITKGSSGDTANPPSPEAVAVIMYTSGTNGLPKGVILPHDGFVAVASGMKHASGEGLIPGRITALFLPLGHILPTVVILASFLGGGSIGLYHGDPAALIDDFKAMKPECIPGVPRVYQGIYNKVIEEFKKQIGCKQQYIKNAIDTQTENYRSGKPRDKGLDKKVFSKLQETVGGNLKFAITGASPMLPALQEWFKVCFNVKMTEGYGLTESYGVALAQEPDWGVVGNVGAPLNCTEVRLHDCVDFGYLSTDDPPKGELCVRGAVMRGYFKDDEKTKEEIDKDGWLHTGDIARRNQDGTFSIIDRISNIFKLGVGNPIVEKHKIQGSVLVAPEVIESQLASCALVNQAYVFGSPNYKHTVAILVPDVNGLLKKAGGAVKVKGDKGWNEEFARICSTPEAVEWIMQDIEPLVTLKKIKEWEKPVRIHLEGVVDDVGFGFNVQNGLLTPTLKLRRGICKKYYTETLQKLYALDDVEWKN